MFGYYLSKGIETTYRPKSQNTMQFVSWMPFNRKILMKKKGKRGKEEERERGREGE